MHAYVCDGSMISFTIYPGKFMMQTMHVYFKIFVYLKFMQEENYQNVNFANKKHI